MTRTSLLALLLLVPIGLHAAPAPVKPKVIATPTPAPALPTPADPNKPPVRRKPAQKSVATLVAEYTKSVKATLGARWQEAAADKAKDFTAGSLAFTFKVDAEGKVVEFAVKNNTSNEALASFCETLVKGTVFEKPPARALADGQLEIPFNFTIY